jgi:hypothetical protein
METETLLERIDRSTDEEKELIARVIDRSRSFQQSLLKALAEVKQNKQATVIKIFRDVEIDKFSKLFSDLIIDFIQPYSFTDKNLINKIRKNPFLSFDEIISSPKFLEELNFSSPLVIFRLKGIKAKWDLLFGDDLPLDSKEVAFLLNISPQTVNKWRRQGRLLGVRFGQYKYLYPAWQFQNTSIMGGLDLVLDELREYDDWTRLAFLKTGDIRLNGATPLEKLRAGDVESVVWAASCYGRQISA